MLDGSTREVFGQPDILKQTYVEPPQITRLGQGLTGEGIPQVVLTVEEMKQVFDGREPA